MKKTFLNIPVSVCIYSVQRNCIDEFQLFCWLKLNCNHRFNITDQIRFAAINNLGITRQTLNTRIDWLLKHKWINFNSKTDSFHINSFLVIHQKTTFSIVKGVLWENYDIKKFKAFVWAGIIGYYAKRKHFIDQNGFKLTDKGKPRVRMNKARPMMNSAPCPFNLPLSYLAKSINKPKSTIQKMKALAKNEFFIEVENCFEDSNLLVSELQRLRRFSNSAPEIKKYVLIAGRVKEQLPDKIYLCINFRSKRKLKHI
ncbi:MAG: hypothetical protein A2066_14675 [Bacteroidetes bacterium GWB2_41_8]|nr:MAG: hypothetical protein A2066_14675 [Bacteroidetes bacterium GWB2_41_8]